LEENNQLNHDTMKTLPTNTYTYQVMQGLKSGRSITSNQAIDELGCTRLSAVIFRLRNDYDLQITDNLIAVKNRNGRTVKIARYKLITES
jgi:hypothetical protein